MLIPIVIALMGMMSMVLAVVPLEARQAPACPPPATVTVTATVEAIAFPGSITMAIVGPTALAAEISSIESIDTEQYLMESQLEPVSNGPYPASSAFTHTLDVGAYYATRIIDGTTYFYAPDPSATATESVPITTLTDVVTHPGPVPTNPADGINQTIHNTTFVTATVSRSYVSLSDGYEYSIGSSDSSVIAGGILTSTYTTDVATVTTNVLPSSSPKFSNSTVGYGNPSGEQTTNGELQPRQTCVEVSAGAFGTWCNNWDGSTTLPYTTWETTTTPGVTASQAPSPPVNTTAPTPSDCGETGPFVIGFEDLPVFSTNNPNTTEQPPVDTFNPHDHFDWGSGWTYGPPPGLPYQPHDGTHLAEIVPPLNSSVASTLTDGVLPMGFGAGYRKSDDHYWFNAYTAWVGCNDTAADPTVTCDFVATAWQYDPDRKQDTVFSTQHMTVPPCSLGSGCQLQEVTLEASFRNMSSMSFYGVVQGKPVSVFIDTLALDWYNNTCEAGLARISSRKV